MELSVVQREQAVQGLLAGDAATDGMDDHAGFDVDFALRVWSGDFEQAGATAKTLDLNDVGQTHRAQSAGETFALFPANQVIQQVEHKAHAIPRDRLFEKK